MNSKIGQLCTEKKSGSKNNFENCTTEINTSFFSLSFSLFFIHLFTMGYHSIECFNQTFEVPEKYKLEKEIGQGAYGSVW